MNKRKFSVGTWNSLIFIALVIGLNIPLLGCNRASSPVVIAADAYPELGFTILDGNAKDSDWSPGGNWIAYPRRDPKDWYYDVWLIRPDGTDKHCITCGENFPQKHNGNVTWHPSSEYLIFTAQNEDAKGDKLDSVAIPGVGLNCNLWAMSADGEAVWQLTNLLTHRYTPQGVLHPQFSHDGEKLFWAQALGKYNPEPGEEWGKWQLAIADFVVEDGTPRLENIVYSQPGTHPRFYESHGWSPDDSLVIFSSNPEEGPHPPNGIDIYTMDVATGEIARLTNTPTDWDEHAHISPDGSTVAWMSGAELDIKFPSVKWPDWKEYITTELWMMSADGSDQQRITYFNEPGNQHHTWLQKLTNGTVRAVISDSSWSPDGSQLIFTLAYEAEEVKDGLGVFLILMEVEQYR